MEAKPCNNKDRPCWHGLYISNISTSDYVVIEKCNQCKVFHTIKEARKWFLQLMEQTANMPTALLPEYPRQELREAAAL